LEGVGDARADLQRDEAEAAQDDDGGDHRHRDADLDRVDRGGGRVARGCHDGAPLRTASAGCHAPACDG